jgi:hypothetical protein
MTFSCAYTLMLVSRQEQLEPHLRVLLLVGGRYVFFTEFLALIAIVVLASILPLPHRLFPMAALALALAIAVNTLVIAARQLHNSLQWNPTHTFVWASILRDASNAVAQDQPIPDRQLPNIEFPLTSRAFEGLIRRQLGIPASHVLRWETSQTR